MIEPIPVVEENIYAFRFRGRLTHDDYREFIPLVEDLIRQHGRISLLLELEDFRGWDTEAAFDDFRFGTRHEDDFERIAVVGDKAWERWMVALARPFTDAEIRYFDRDHIDEAWAWLKATPEPADQPPEPRPWQHVLVATDFSLASRHAVVQARRLAQLDGARLSVIHVIEEPIVYDEYGVYLPMEVDLDQALLEAARQHMQRLVEELALEDAVTEIEFGAPAATVVEYAREQDCDLIVTGSRGRRG
ncbi:MAG: hypothetical protein D6717_02950, partial [Gammaproteobacteria bacterium]